MYLHYTSYAKNIIHYVFDDDMKMNESTYCIQRNRF